MHPDFVGGGAFGFDAGMGARTSLASSREAEPMITFMITGRFSDHFFKKADTLTQP